MYHRPSAAIFLETGDRFVPSVDSTKRSQVKSRRERNQNICLSLRSRDGWSLGDRLRVKSSCCRSSLQRGDLYSTSAAGQHPRLETTPPSVSCPDLVFYARLIPAIQLRLRAMLLRAPGHYRTCRWSEALLADPSSSPPIPSVAGRVISALLGRDRSRHGQHADMQPARRLLPPPSPRR